MAAPEHNDSAKVFMAGKSQAVRLPRNIASTLGAMRYQFAGSAATSS